MGEIEADLSANYPWVKFKLHGERYCITSRHVSSMGAMSKVTSIPDREAFFLGMIEVAGRLVPIIDLRTLLHLPSLQSDLDAFATMKQMHIDWIERLSDCVQENRSIDVNRNPHKCTFGIWYDSYKSDNNVIDFILNKIKEPHEQLHQCPQRIDDALAAGNREQAQVILAEADELCHKQMIPLLDELIQAYDDANRGMVIVLNDGTEEDKSMGIVVDEIIGLEEFTDKKERDAVSLFGATEYIKDIYVSSNQHIYLELDGGKLLALERFCNP